MAHIPASWGLRLDHVDARAVRLRVLGEIRRRVGFDAYAWPLTDPETAVGTAPLADVPCLPELPRLIRLKYLTPVNRWTALRPGAVATLHTATGGNPARSLLWREMLNRHGVADVASVVFADRFGVWAFLDLWRSRPFTDAETRTLTRILEPVTAELRRAQAETFVARDGLPARSGPVVLLLSPDLDVLGHTPDTAEYLRVLVPPGDGQAPVPAGAYNVAAQLLANEAGVDGHRPAARVHLADGRWVTLRAARIVRDIAVTIEESAPAERVGLFGRAFGLSTRERELLEHLAHGSDTRDLARRMFLSEHTVQDHLKSIFGKTSVRNRRTLLARALGG